ncbi:MAG: hypothetical protein DMF81_16625 [Acidobacteria bacterium]|nr:MAG: hypothetical protein DMF81_16625 [Acidobacteriota bacterium]
MERPTPRALAGQQRTERKHDHRLPGHEVGMQEEPEERMYAGVEVDGPHALDGAPEPGQDPHPPEPASGERRDEEDSPQGRRGDELRAEAPEPEREESPRGDALDLQRPPGFQPQQPGQPAGDEELQVQERGSVGLGGERVVEEPGPFRGLAHEGAVRVEVLLEDQRVQEPGVTVVERVGGDVGDAGQDRQGGRGGGHEPQVPRAPGHLGRSSGGLRRAHSPRQYSGRSAGASARA